MMRALPKNGSPVGGSIGFPNLASGGDPSNGFPAGRTQSSMMGDKHPGYAVSVEKEPPPPPPGRSKGAKELPFFLPGGAWANSTCNHDGCSSCAQGTKHGGDIVSVDKRSDDARSRASTVYSPEDDPPLSPSEVRLKHLSPVIRTGHLSDSLLVQKAHRDVLVGRVARAQGGSSTLPVFNLVEIEHDDHFHVSLASLNKKDPLIKFTNEGCPCCTAGLDFDEFAAALVKISNQSKLNEEGVFSLAEFDSAAHWGIALGVAAPFSIIGLTAAIRNIRGCYDNREKLKTAIETVGRFIKDSQYAYLTHPTTQNLNVIKTLKAFKDTLSYSKFDSEFNLLVPGVINGIASGFVLSSLVWHSPVALVALAGYSVAQLGRNVYDLARVWNHALDPNSGVGLEPMGQCHQTNDLRDLGIQKVNHIGRSQRRFFGLNAMGFASFAAGSLLTVLSLPALGLGVGAATLPVGLALLGAGAVSTGIMNNIWTGKFRPRNSDLGTERTTSSLGSLLKDIGDRRELKRVLKDDKEFWIQRSRFKRFRYKVRTALPSLPKRLKRYFKAKSGEELIHQDNIKLFEKKCKLMNVLGISFEKTRAQVFNKLLEIKSKGSNAFPKDANTFEEQWEVCQKLGIQDDIAKVLVDNFLPSTVDPQSHDHHHCGHHAHGDHHAHHHQDHHHHDHGACCSSSKEDYINKLKRAGFKDGGSSTWTLDVEGLTSEQAAALGKAIDFYLHFGYIKKLRYEQYGLVQYFWALKKRLRTPSN